MIKRRGVVNLTAYLQSLKVIPNGTFHMGGSDAEIDATPKHSVRMSKYRMGATPVTVAVWKEYCGATGTKLPEPPAWGLRDDHPIVNVSWNDIMGADGTGGFCAWASDVAGYQLTLPTEAQFEYAARGGHDGWTYPWGKTFDNSKIWCSVLINRKSVAPLYRSNNVYRNAYGLTDMVGNVWQWCLDGQRNYKSKAITDPKGSLGVLRCKRGGTFWQNQESVFNVSQRGFELPDVATWHHGFRLISPFLKGS
jgi:formylglycine-generating enzyme required for sulfatase activity